MRGPDRAAAIAESNNHTGRRMQPIVSEIASWNPKVEALGRPRLAAWLGQAPTVVKFLPRTNRIRIPITTNLRRRTSYSKAGRFRSTIFQPFWLIAGPSIPHHCVPKSRSRGVLCFRLVTSRGF